MSAAPGADYLQVADNVLEILTRRGLLRPEAMSGGIPAQSSVVRP